jgi:hypothetical protein
MSLETEALILLAGYTIAREILFLYQVHTLLNKLMSRNYGDYEIAKRYGKESQESTGKEAEPDSEFPEDLRPIQNFGVN